MSTSIRVFSNIPEQKAPAVPPRQIYLLEKGSGKSGAELCTMKPECCASKCAQRRSSILIRQINQGNYHKRHAVLPVTVFCSSSNLGDTKSG